MQDRAHVWIKWGYDVGAGCSLYVDNTQLLVSQLVTLNFVGQASYALPIPAAFPPTDLAAQAIEFYPGGPFLGWGGVSNGLLIRAGGVGCP